MAAEGIVYIDIAEPNSAVFLEVPGLPFPDIEAPWSLVSSSPSTNNPVIGSSAGDKVCHGTSESLKYSHLSLRSHTCPLRDLGESCTK